MARRSPENTSDEGSGSKAWLLVFLAGVLAVAGVVWLFIGALDDGEESPGQQQGVDYPTYGTEREGGGELEAEPNVRGEDRGRADEMTTPGASWDRHEPGQRKQTLHDTDRAAAQLETYEQGTNRTGGDQPRESGGEESAERYPGQPEHVGGPQQRGGSENIENIWDMPPEHQFFQNTQRGLFSQDKDVVGKPIKIRDAHVVRVLSDNAFLIAYSPIRSGEVLVVLSEQTRQVPDRLFPNQLVGMTGHVATLEAEQIERMGLSEVDHPRIEDGALYIQAFAVVDRGAQDEHWRQR